VRPNHLTLLVLLLLLACAPKQPRQTQPTLPATPFYFPGGGDNWERRSPEAVGLNDTLLRQAVWYAQWNETTQMPRDFSTQEEIFGKLLGPMPAARGGTNGIILRGGYIVAEWGDTGVPEPTYSVAKSFLSTLLGLALHRRMIGDIKDPVVNYIRDGGYDSAHNRQVTWEHHVQQTSEWEGEMWGKRHDFVGREAFGQGERPRRALQKPGTYYEYNDVRINRLALSLLRLWQKPLPDVLKAEIMDPIGASDTWRYVPYHNSIVEINGQSMPSVSGGTRWGGGLWINTRDEARFGYLFLRRGRQRPRRRNR